MPEGFLVGPDFLARTRRAVQAVEGNIAQPGFRKTQPLLEGDLSPNQKVFRIATFSGPWNPNSQKQVQFDSTGQTVNAFNRTFPLFSVPATTQISCSVAKEGTAWHLIDVGKNQSFGHLFAGNFETRTVVTDIQIAATLNTSNCSITVSKTVVTATVTIVVSTYTASFVSLAGQSYPQGV